MKTFRKILSILLSIILFDVVFLFILSLSLKSVINDNLIKDIIISTVKEETNNTNSIPKITNNTTEGLTNEQYNEIVKDFMNDYSDELTNQIIASIKDPESANDAEISNALIEYIKTNKNEIESKYNITITDDDINKLENSEALIDADKEFSTVLQSSSIKITDEQREFIKVYDYLTSNNFRIILGVVASILLVLIALLQWSWFKWMRVLGNTLFISGIFNLISAAIMNITTDALIEELELDISLNINPLYIMSVVIMIIGIVLFITYQVIKHFINNKNTNNQDLSNKDLYQK